MENTPLFWILFTLFVNGLLLGLLVLNRRAHTVPLREALDWSVCWTTLSLGCNHLAYRAMGHVRMAFSSTAGPQIDSNSNHLVRLLNRHLPLTQQLDGSRFFIRRDGLRIATPLPVVVETISVVVAAYSIPAILTVSHDTFVGYTSNVVALLGRRALYFALASLLTLFHYLPYGLALILVFIGGKLLAEDPLREYFNLKLPVPVSLGIVGVLLLGSVGASLLRPHQTAA